MIDTEIIFVHLLKKVTHDEYPLEQWLSITVEIFKKINYGHISEENFLDSSGIC
jgi:hypothetical protein